MKAQEEVVLQCCTHIFTSAFLIFLAYLISLGFLHLFQIIHCIILNHVRWVPCYHGTARPQVADGKDGLQIWRVAANTLNKQSRTADKGGTSAWGLGVGLSTHRRKN
jgi:hypothetical protein